MEYLFLLMVAHVAVILPVSFSSYGSSQHTVDSGDVQILENNVLQIYHVNTWIQACASGFNKGAASAACRQLGFIDADSFEPHNTSQFSMAYTSIKCPTVSNYSLYGELHIFRCSLGSLTNTHCTPVAVECSQVKLLNQYNGQLSLDPQHSYNPPVKLQSSSDGFVEMFLNGHSQRYHICYNEEIHNNDNIGLSICRQLGYTDVGNVDFFQPSPEMSFSFLNFSCINNSYACFSHCIKGGSLGECSHDRQLHIDCSFDLNKVLWQTSGSQQCEIPPVDVLSSYKTATYSLGGIILAEVIVVMVIGIIIFLTYCMCCRKGKRCKMVCRCRFRPNSDEPLIHNNENFKLLVAIT